MKRRLEKKVEGNPKNVGDLETDGIDTKEFAVYL